MLFGVRYGIFINIFYIFDYSIKFFIYKGYRYCVMIIF